MAVATAMSFLFIGAGTSSLAAGGERDEVRGGVSPSLSIPADKGTEIDGHPVQGGDEVGTGIVGGTVAAAGAYPFFTAVKRASDNFAFCGGTLVSSVWVLTSANCVDGGVTAASLKLVIGANQLNNEAPGEVRSVTAIHLHPSWNPSTFDNDVALLRLNTASTKTWARMAEPIDPVNPGNTVRALGHGHTTQGGVASNDLRQVDLPIQSDATMSAAAQYGASFHGAVMIGAGPLAGGQDTCQGDTGGPLFISGGQARLVGVTSWGAGCAQPNKPGIYAEVYQGTLRTFVNGLVGRPSNDNFAGVGISGADGTASGNNTNATGQTGEPNIAGSPADTSVWYSWTAPENGPTTFNVRDAAFDTTLHVFTGGSFAGLASVASNDDFNGTLQSKVSFTALAGTTYRIAVDGFSAAHGTFSLQYAQNSPANDNFASATVITGAAGKQSGNSGRSTGEPGEPNHGSIPDRSVWYSWTAPETGQAVFNTRESNFDTVIAAYTGTAIASLTQIASNDQTNGSNQSKITFPVTAGTVYRIAVDGFGSTTGNVGLQWSTDPPANDDFGAPKILDSCAGTTSATTVRTTGEPGESGFHGGATPDNSAWFSWTPTVSGPATVQLSSVAAGFSPGVGVYTGDSIAALTPVGNGATTVSLTVVAGTTYRIAVDGNSGSTGTFDLAWAPTAECNLIVTKAGAGSGTVTASGIDCGSDCSQSFPDATTVVLDATADPGSIFGGWSGCDTITDGDCVVTTGSVADRTVTATFEPSHTLSVGIGGNGGTGSVSGPGISCGDDCSEAYAIGSLVTLSATPGGGSTLTGWDGCDEITAGGSECVVTMDADRTAVALFDPPVLPGPGPGPGADPANPLQTTITGLKLKKAKGKAKVSFAGSGGQGVLSFSCRLDRRKYKPCTSPKRYKPGPGKHRVRVIATDATGAKDATPAKVSFKLPKT